MDVIMSTLRLEQQQTVSFPTEPITYAVMPSPIMTSLQGTSWFVTTYLRGSHRDKGNMKTPESNPKPPGFATSFVRRVLLNFLDNKQGSSKSHYPLFHINSEILQLAFLGRTQLCAHFEPPQTPRWIPQLTGEGSDQRQPPPDRWPGALLRPKPWRQRLRTETAQPNSPHKPGRSTSPASRCPGPAPHGGGAGVSRGGRDTHIVLVVHGHAQAEEEVGDVRVSRRAGPVQRGPVVLREGGSGGERESGGRGAACDRSRPAGSGPAGRPLSPRRAGRAAAGWPGRPWWPGPCRAAAGPAAPPGARRRPGCRSPRRTRHPPCWRPPRRLPLPTGAVLRRARRPIRKAPGANPANRT